MQLRLLPPPRPLVERLERGFFRTLPKRPGVYWMLDRAGRIVYVGQSANLRDRVGSYRYVSPERSSRKMVRLVHSVEEIRWECCESAEAARLRENQLLRAHRPRFNTLNVWPKAHVFLGISAEPEFLHFCFTRQFPAHTEISEASDAQARMPVELQTRRAWEFFGAFKTSCLTGYQSLLRLLWTVFYEADAPSDYPRQLINVRPPVEFEFPLHGCRTALPDVEMLFDLCAGDSARLCDWLSGHLGSVARNSPFQQSLVKSDMANLERFYLTGPQRNRELKRLYSVESALIGQEELDDLLVRRLR